LKRGPPARQTIRIVMLARRAPLLVAFGVGPAAAACGLDAQGLMDVPGGPPLDATVVDAGDEGPSAAGDARAADAEDAAARDAAIDQDDAGESGGDAAQEAAQETGAVEDAGDAGCDASAPEICDDGVDDNCNGLVDCADPSCASQGFACAPAAPAGWKLVAYAAAGRPPCPSGWGSTAPLVEGPDGGGGSCPCTCGSAAANPCTQGQLTLSMGGDLGCNCGNVQNMTMQSDGGCDPIGRTIGAPCALSTWSKGSVSTPPPAQVECAQSAVLPALTYAAQGETCVPLGAAGAGCASGGACLPSTGATPSCVEHDGIVTSCPAGFATLHVAYAPSDVHDERACASCACKTTTTSCSKGTLTLYDDSACAKPAVTIAADGNCNGYSGDPSSAAYFVYSAAPDTTACAGTATTTVDGGVVAKNPLTICCP
jgi:hypothetical protein